MKLRLNGRQYSLLKAFILLDSCQDGWQAGLIGLTTPMSAVRALAIPMLLAKAVQCILSGIEPVEFVNAQSGGNQKPREGAP